MLASELIRDAILRHKARDIPIAVSMANVAASGGYWVSTPADRIFAEPETITGSIGIFAVIPTFEETAAMAGVTSDGVRTTPLSGQPDLIAGFTPETDAILQAFIEDGYEDFLERVGEARSLTREQADAVGQGRVWDGGTARQLRLVDEYGGIEEALAWTAERAELGTDWHVLYLGEAPSTYDTLLRQWLIGDGEEAGSGGDVIARMTQSRSAFVARIAADADRLLGTRGVQAYCLACPAPQPAAAQDRAATGWLARIVQLVIG